MENIQEKANKQAQKYGFDTAKFLGRRDDKNVYVCYFEIEHGYTGSPVFLLENNGEFQLASVKEKLSLKSMLKNLSKEEN